jgi:transcription elongation factor SPT5
MFKIGELVQLKNSNTVCYIIESTKFIIRVVSTSNEVKKMSVREVDKITLPKKATCIDGKGNPLDLDNTVKVIKGQYKGFKGVIKAIYRKFVFLLNYDFTRTNGIFCEIKENLELLGSELLLESNDKGRVNHRRIPNEIKDLMGKTVHVIKGIWKGYNGILKEGNDKNVKLELIAKQKTVELPFDHILKGDVNSVKENNDNTSFNNRQFMKTPAYYEQHKDAWE